MIAGQGKLNQTHQKHKSQEKIDEFTFITVKTFSTSKVR